MKNPLALIIDDEPDIRELLEITLQRMNIDCVAAADLREALQALKQHSFQLCLTDMRLPDGNGLDIVAEIQKSYPQTPVAVITAHGNMETAIQALKSGAFDFVTKPVELSDLRTLVTSALKLAETTTPQASRLIGESAAIIRTRSTIDKLARSQAPVYISGESGSGKELVARMIHAQGSRRDAPFVPVNCGAIPQDLMESEFFGHRKGSFTGAVADKPGLFQAADKGTMFLDEVAELPLHMQVKLLRAIQEKSVRPVGAQVETSVDVRILSATHKDLAKLAETGEFRQDLFYRINVIELAVPALRERRGDIEKIAMHILGKLSSASGEEQPGLSQQALGLLCKYDFPGNVRELENILERAMTLCEGNQIMPADLQLPEQSEQPLSKDSEQEGLGDYLEELEKQKIINALEKTRWNKTAAARLLGISFRALRYRLQKLGLD